MPILWIFTNLNKIIMKNEEKLQKIIAAYTPFDYTKISLKKEIMDNYIAAEFKGNFCDDISHFWRKTNSTQLYNSMFVTLKTGEDILNKINHP